MADNIELPNVDIFDPVMCARRWTQCATQQQINIYLNEQIGVNRKVLTDTIDAQNQINASVSGGIKDHASRIAALESKVAELDTAQTNLNAAFQSLTTDNNNFKSNVDLLLNQYQSTINLLQTNIDKISVSNEQLWNEVNNIKSAIDIDKINAAIAGYQSVLADSKKYTDEQVSVINDKLDVINKTASDNYSALDGKIDGVNRDMTANYNNLTDQVTAADNAQNTKINEFISGVNLTIQNFDIFYKKEVSRLDGRIDDLTSVVAANRKESQDNLTALAGEMQNEDNALREEYTSFNSSQSMIIESNRAAAEQADTALGVRIDETNGELELLSVSDGKQWDTINNILDAQNRINKQQDAFAEEFKEHEQSNEDSFTGIGNRLNAVEEAAQPLALRVEYLEQRTGWKERATASAGSTGAVKYSVGFGALTFNTTNTQVSFSLALNGGVTGLICVPATGYNMPNVIGTGSTNVITNAANPNIITGWIMNYQGSQSPIEFIIFYDPATKLVTFLSQYETNSSVMPKSGVASTVQP